MWTITITSQTKKHIYKSPGWSSLTWDTESIFFSWSKLFKAATHTHTHFAVFAAKIQTPHCWIFNKTHTMVHKYLHCAHMQMSLLHFKIKIVHTHHHTVTLRTQSIVALFPYTLSVHVCTSVVRESGWNGRKTYGFPDAIVCQVWQEEARRCRDWLFNEPLPQQTLNGVIRGPCEILSEDHLRPQCL